MPPITSPPPGNRTDMDNPVSQKVVYAIERTAHGYAGERIDCQKISRSLIWSFRERKFRHPELVTENSFSWPQQLGKIHLLFENIIANIPCSNYFVN
jgi:hypothetical protein